jgi:diaminohydroxyphosphoribosylaminopyrimidine deaminase/5-amino-6-(5-phosphoribosylamino)uracil reductase
LPDGSELELLSGTLEEELRRLAQQNVQSLLLEGGPTLASSFFAGGLVDKIMLFVAPTIAGAGPAVVTSLDEAVSLTRSSARPVGEDVLLTAYVHEP